MEGILFQTFSFLYKHKDDTTKEEIYKNLLMSIDIQKPLDVRVSDYLNELRSNSIRFNNLLVGCINEILYSDKQKLQDQGKYITTIELCKILGLTRGRINQLIKEGRIKDVIQKDKHFKIQIPYTEIDRYVNTNEKYKPAWEKYKRDFGL